MPNRPQAYRGEWDPENASWFRVFFPMHPADRTALFAECYIVAEGLLDAPNFLHEFNQSWQAIIEGATAAYPSILGDASFTTFPRPPLARKRRSRSALMPRYSPPLPLARRWRRAQIRW